MSERRVIFLDVVHPLVWESLRDAGHDCIDHSETSEEDLKEHLSDAYGLIVRHRLRLGKELLKYAESLQWIGRSGIGLDKIDIDYCEARGINVLNAAGGNADAVGEHVIGMLLNLLNHQKRADIEVRQGIWQREANRGSELGAKKVGIIGYGNTGQSFAQKLNGFGTEVLAYDKYQKVSSPYARSASLEEIQAEADIISFHVPLNDETKYYFNEPFLLKMKHSFILINAARGGVAKLSAISEGIRSGKILGVALDVLEKEGQDHEVLLPVDKDLQFLIASENVLFSPHIAGWTVESYEKLAKVMVRRILELD